MHVKQLCDDLQNDL